MSLEQLAKKEFLSLLLSDPERITHEDNEEFRMHLHPIALIRMSLFTQRQDRKI